MTTTQHIIHELPVPQSVQDLRAACGLPAVTVRHGDQVHQFAYTTQPEYVTCVGCLAVREVTAARAALGEGWLTGGVTLAEGIERKTRALEQSIADQARLQEVAYPRALQAAASLVTVSRMPSSIIDDAPEILRWVDETADAILELTGEQVEAFDSKVEREHVAAAPKPERPVVIWHYRGDEEDLPSCDDPDEALVNAIDEQAGLVYADDGTQLLEEPHLLDDEITLYGYARMEVKVNGERILENVLENLDDDHGQPGPWDGTKPTPAMIEAAHTFANAIEDGYESWACEVVEKRVINVREWCAAHAPGWLAQLPARDDEEGGAE